MAVSIGVPRETATGETRVALVPAVAEKYAALGAEVLVQRSAGQLSHIRDEEFTAATLVNRLEESQKQYQLERFLKQLDKLELLVCDELGYLSFNRSGAELLFQVFADRYERSSLLITSNLPFSEWQQVFQGERMTAALLDRLTHHCEIFEMNGESYRFRESMKQKRTIKSK
jgi:DNA replication protein DnaC